MEKIKVKLYATLRDKVGKDIVYINASNVREAITEILKLFPSLKGEIVDENGKLKDDYIYLVNGRNIVFLQNEDTPLKNGDKLTIFPPVGGG